MYKFSFRPEALEAYANVEAKSVEEAVKKAKDLIYGAFTVTDRLLVYPNPAHISAWDIDHIDGEYCGEGK